MYLLYDHEWFHSTDGNQRRGQRLGVVAGVVARAHDGHGAGSVRSRVLRGAAFRKHWFGAF